ncbi:tetratricopeptide repeat protein [Aeoliella mucimassa]|uniref:Tetratricopeptide repeat protein n=1 Tax=Aeoliella mucimassa TaxID=2527972 RepID=A0A518AHR8_9BACT|nr:tetratricopeptide repeat protein [Aeoliella mucimassa]QDU54276.1 Tetratricopeptide repeat protein [Aeoliella mucimassa]
MALPIEGYTVVLLKQRVAALLEQGKITPPNSTVLQDEHLWRCSFMAEQDAIDFVEQLAALELNTTQGPDPDVVLASEFDQSVAPYCEWLQLATWEQAIIAWRAGTKPDSVTAREGWDPKKGSGLTYGTQYDIEKLEFVRLEGNIEVYRDKESGKLLYIGRQTPSLQAVLKSASEFIGQHMIQPGRRPLTGELHTKMSQVVEQLESIREKHRDKWNLHWMLGKGYQSLGNNAQAYKSFRTALELNNNEEAILRELAGLCLTARRFDEAVGYAQTAASAKPDDPQVLGNLAISYLLAGRMEKASKTIRAAMPLNEQDQVNQHIYSLILQVEQGHAAPPRSLTEAMLSQVPVKRKKKFWQIWK